uniref:Retrotransposon protein, putative, Ty3-gypsy sub-class n=2 Tax=Oryza sativa subsp. japonica TaxID=39947 RepID=Q2RA07_ORYSJ|nr:retrotransposon protein, putative, Ty3-gypsy sub-class [Oryza sativa Japonica Group]ABA91625.1 retrotransposon protein, putative, Ty3-gypsy subclass [Oryza sativa Japonica Group]
MASGGGAWPPTAATGGARRRQTARKAAADGRSGGTAKGGGARGKGRKGRGRESSPEGVAATGAENEGGGDDRRCRGADGQWRHLEKGRRGVRDGEDDRDDQSGRPEMDENGELTGERGKQGFGGDWWQPSGGRGAGGTRERDDDDFTVRRQL